MRKSVRDKRTVRLECNRLLTYRSKNLKEMAEGFGGDIGRVGRMGGVGWGDGEGRGSVGEIGGIRGVRRRAGAAPGNAAHAGYTTAAAHTHTHTCTQPTQAGHRTKPCTGRTHVRSARASTHQAHGRAHALPAHARPSSGTLSPVAHPPRTWPRRGRSRVHARYTATHVPLPHSRCSSHAHTRADCQS